MLSRGTCWYIGGLLVHANNSSVLPPTDYTRPSQDVMEGGPRQDISTGLPASRLPTYLRKSIMASGSAQCACGLRRAARTQGYVAGRGRATTAKTRSAWANRLIPKSILSLQLQKCTWYPKLVRNPSRTQGHVAGGRDGAPQREPRAEGLRASLSHQTRRKSTAVLCSRRRVALRSALRRAAAKSR